MRKFAFLTSGILASLLNLLPWPAAGQSALGPALPLAEAPANLRFGHLGVEQGISHTTVWDVLQDRSGFLWIGTESSLQRYDGYELVDFRHDPQDPRSLSDSEVMRIYEDRAGILYFATRSRGINRYDPAAGRFERFLLDGEQAETTSDVLSPLVYSMADEPSGRLWIGTGEQGIRLLDPKTRRLESFRHLEADPASLGDDQVDALFRDRADRLWIGHGRGLDRWLPESRSFVHVPLGAVPAAVNAVGQTAAGGLWALAATDNQSTLYFEQDGAFAPRASWPFYIGRARQAPDGTFFFGTFGAGLYHYDPSSGNLSNARCRLEDRESLSSDIVMSLRFDRAGLLWIGTRNGLSIYDPRRVQFDVARLGRGLPISSVGLIQVDRRGDAWLGSLEGELVRWNPRANTFQLVASGLGAINAFIETRAGVLWAGASGGIFRVDPESGRLTKAPAELPSAVSAIFEDRDGYLWLGLGDGLARADAEGRLAPLPGNPEKGQEWPRSFIYSLVGDREGKLWVAAEGLYRIDPRTLEVKSWHYRSGDPGALPYAQASDVLEDREGRLWVATYGGGLALLDRASGTFTRYGSSEGLADDRVCSLLEDDGGGIWASTNRGLSLFDPRTRKSRNYDSADGLASDVFMIVSRAKFPDGRIAFGGHQGLTAFYPDRLQSDRVAPPVLLTELRVGGEVMRPGDRSSPLAHAISSSRQFSLDFRQRSFALQFAAPHFANPKKNRYLYRLVGYEEGWTESGASDRRARYTNLDPGSYTFEVKASNEDGVWNEDGTRIGIAVLPAPWRTPWAYALYAATILGAIYAYSRWQSRRVERERRVADELARLNAELERLVEDRTSEVNQLTGLLPICSGCKKIRDQEGHWQTLEKYLASVGDVKLSHGICRDCAKRYYPELDIDQLAG